LLGKIAYIETVRNPFLGFFGTLHTFDPLPFGEERATLERRHSRPCQDLVLG
jgi:hypothetical protein